MALLEVKNLSVRYPVRTPLFRKQRYLYAVNDVSFSLEKGETIGLVGESGCGKSTLGKALVRLEDACAGEILLNGTDLAHAKGRTLRDMRELLGLFYTHFMTYVLIKKFRKVNNYFFLGPFTLFLKN